MSQINERQPETHSIKCTVRPRKSRFTHTISRLIIAAVMKSSLPPEAHLQPRALSVVVTSYSRALWVVRLNYMQVTPDNSAQSLE